MPRVISYTRFSTRKQSKGDSHRRQTEMAQAWCAKNGHELDTSLALADLGVSGFSGANAEKGALSVLLELVNKGMLEPGTILLIEAFDRLTREELSESVTLVLGLVNSGLTIVTLSDEKAWTKASLNDLPGFMLSLLLLHRGHEESSAKADRLQRTFRAARKAGSKQPFGAAPGWLYRNSKEESWQVNEELAAVVRKVFDYAINGYGSKAIAKIANEQSWPVPTRLNMTEGRWHPQMPGILLRNRSVLGVHEHHVTTYEARDKHWKGISTGDVIKDYYPRIISDDIWYQARAAIDARAMDKRRDTHYFNIFSGLMFCGYCGAPIHRKSELGAKRKPSLVCSHKLSGGSTLDCVTTMAPNTDIPILLAVWEYAKVMGLSGGGAAASKQSAEIAALEAKLTEKTAEAERVGDAISGGLGGSKILLRKMQAVELELAEIEEALEAKRAERASGAAGSIFDEDYDELRKYIDSLYVAHDDDARDLRAKLHVRLRMLVECVWIWGYDVALVKFKSGEDIMPVELSEKRLPSRERPEAKYHKPAAKRRTKPKPFLALARKAELVPPAPKLTFAMQAKRTADYIVVGDDDEEIEAEVVD